MSNEAVSLREEALRVGRNERKARDLVCRGLIACRA